MYGFLHNSRTGYTTHYFQEIKRTHKFNYICETCGKPRQKTYEASATVNPFNKNANGSIKSEWEVRADVDRKIDQYIKEFDHEVHICGKCRDEIRAGGSDEK